MNELVIVRSAEITLGAMALVAIVIILMATWYDFRVLTKGKKLRTTPPTSPLMAIDTKSIASIRTLPAIFSKLSRIMIAKALSWRAAEIHKASTHTTLRPIRSLHTALFASLGLALYIGMLTYFCYTAATLRSNTLLTLSWIGVSLWLAATVWSNEKMSLSKKIEITYAIPFMYFVFYALAFPLLMRYLSHATNEAVQILRAHSRQLTEAVRVELYSTRF